MLYHLYRRTIFHGGKKIRVWYFWYYDKRGRQVRRSCGTGRKPCLTRRDAEAFLARLKQDEPSAEERKFVRDYAQGLYDEGSQFLRRRTAKGFEIADVTRRQAAHRLKVFLDEFGRTKPRDLSMPDIEDWLLAFDYSNSWRNHTLSVVRDVFEVLYEGNAIDKMPLISGFRKSNVSKKCILYAPEIDALFPKSMAEIGRIWCAKGEDFYSGFSLCAICFCMLSTGMRSGEARAIQKSQFVRRDAILLNASLDNDNNRVDGLKKRTETDRRWRMAVLPDRAADMLAELERMRDPNCDYVFERGGKPIDRGYLLDRLRRALANIGVDAKGRNITVHSLRFTYNTMMKGEVSGEDLRLMMGHVSETMTDYYDRSNALDRLPALLLNKDKINGIWN